MTAIPNRRRHSRQSAQQLTVIAAWACHERNRQAISNISLCDIGDGGLGIECDDYLMPGDMLMLELSNGHGEPIGLTATICHRAEGEVSASYRYGMFINRSPHEAGSQEATSWDGLLNRAG